MSISTGDLQALVDKTTNFMQDYGETAWLEIEEAILHLKAERLKFAIQEDIRTKTAPSMFRSLGRAIEILEEVKREGKYEIPKLR